MNKQPYKVDLKSIKLIIVASISSKNLLMIYENLMISKNTTPYQRNCLMIQIHESLKHMQPTY